MIQLEHALYSENWPTVKTVLHLHRRLKKLESFALAKTGHMDPKASKMWRPLHRHRRTRSFKSTKDGWH
jgi:hypothetical protein